MKANYVALKNRLESGAETQTYSWSQIEEMIGTRIPTVYVNRRAFKQGNSCFQIYAKQAGFSLTDVNYETQTLTFAKMDRRIVQPSAGTPTQQRTQPIPAAISQQALDPHDLGKDLDEAIQYFKSHWKTTGPHPKDLPFLGKYTRMEDVYYHAGMEAYRASVNNRISLFEGTPEADRTALKEQSARYLAEQFGQLFASKVMNFVLFAEWEHQVATYIRQLYRAAGVGLYTYGNAQKLINVALKYVLSSDLVDYHHEVFKYCFLIIDGKIQKTIKRQLGVDFLHSNGKKCQKQPSWARCDRWLDLYDYQSRIRDAVLRFGYYSPIVWEATHWNA